MNIIELLKEKASSQPDKIALIYGNKQISFLGLEQKSRAVATFFKSKGLHKGESALLFVPMSLELYIIFLGLVRIGITVIFIDLSVGKKHLKQYCSLAKPDVFIGLPKAHLLRFLEPIGSIKHKFSTKLWLPNSKQINYSSTKDTEFLDIDSSPTDPALITFTSGSTGLPKGICRTHGFLISQHNAISSALPSQKEDVELTTLPVFILSNLASGITTVIPNCDLRNPASVDAKKVIEQMLKHNVNRVLASPAFCKQIADRLIKKRQLLTNIQKLHTGGGPVFPSLLQQLSNTMPNAEIITVYGSTEAEPIAHISMQEITTKDYAYMRSGKGLLAGESAPEIKLAIIPDTYGNPINPLSPEEFDTLKLSLNGIGEIVVTGDHVQKSYIGEDNQKIKFRVGHVIWHRTGDAGYLDEQGKLWLLGRCAAKVISNGKAIYPFSIEAAAMSYLEVSRAAFVEVNGQNILAIQLHKKEDKALAQKILCQKIQEELPNIDLVYPIEKIPVDKRHNSKVLYKELKSILSK